MTGNPPAEPRPSREVDELAAALRRLAATARRRRRDFLLAFLLSAAVLQAVGFLWPGTFEARAAVLLQKTRFGAGVDVEPQQRVTFVAGAVSQEEVNSEVAVLTSRTVLEETVAATGLDRLPPPWYLRVLRAPLRAYERAYAWFHGVPYPGPKDRAVAGLAAAVDVQRLKDSNVLVVSYRAGDPRFAEVVLGQLLQRYLGWHVSVHQQGDVRPFFAEQSAALEKEVTDLQQALEKLRTAAGVGDLAAEREALVRQQSSLEEEALALRRRVVELGGRIATLQRSGEAEGGWIPTTKTTRASSATLDALTTQVLQLELENVRLETRFQESSPLVAESRKKLEIARRALEDERAALSRESTSVGLGDEQARLVAERAGVTARLFSVKAQIADVSARRAALEPQAAEADRLALQLQSAKDRYLMYLQRTEQARIDGALDQARVANVTVVQEPLASLKPVRPKRLVTLIVSLGGGLVIALLVCAWRELQALGLEQALASAAPAGGRR